MIASSLFKTVADSKLRALGYEECPTLYLDPPEPQLLDLEKLSEDKCDILDELVLLVPADRKEQVE